MEHYNASVILTEMNKINDNNLIDSWYKCYTKEYFAVLLLDSVVHYEAMIQHLTGYLEKNPHNAIAFHNRGLAYLELGMEEGLADMDRSIAIDNSKPEPHRVLAIFWERNDNLKLALDHYGKALALDNMDFRLYRSRSGIYEKMGEYEKAIEDMSRAILLNPSFKNFFLYRSELYRRIGEVDKAIKDEVAAEKL
jgi:tetratricopeptide (TPR) repeat protein